MTTVADTGRSKAGTFGPLKKINPQEAPGAFTDAILEVGGGLP
jgi:hypothetical protein